MLQTSSILSSSKYVPAAAAPLGHLAIVFTDIKNSCTLWESSAEAMSSAIKLHDRVLRNELKRFGGYEVKTVGDGFMVSFQTPTAALLWSHSVQCVLPAAPWPVEFWNGSHDRNSLRANSDVLYGGLSIRIGAHWGTPQCELNSVTQRMDYLGDMVNRASRISSLAGGSEILVSKAFLSELQRQFDATPRANGIDPVIPEDALTEDAGVRSLFDSGTLNATKFEAKDLGLCSLKGLKKQEHLYLVYSLD
ncbi:cysteinyl-tRNA synthetase [Thelotrema lepadinum]|nr:cysteinyl-tRNA synthetase [Thelotrema lepadinum]